MRELKKMQPQPYRIIPYRRDRHRPEPSPARPDCDCGRPVVLSRRKIAPRGFLVLQIDHHVRCLFVEIGKRGTATHFRCSNPFKNQRFAERKLAGCPLFSRPRTCTTGFLVLQIDHHVRCLFVEIGVDPAVAVVVHSLNQIHEIPLRV